MASIIVANVVIHHVQDVERNEKQFVAEICSRNGNVQNAKQRQQQSQYNVRNVDKFLRMQWMKTLGLLAHIIVVRVAIHPVLDVVRKERR